MPTPPPPSPPPPPEWSNEKIIKFLELYEIERVIWDPCDKNHKLKHKVHDAWDRISKNLNDTPIEELKSKKKSLMATFRPLLRQKKASIRSGAGADDVYQPIWFAFEIMERFLATIYDVESTINTEDRDLHSEQAPSPSQPSTSSITSPSEEAHIQSQQDFEMPPPSPSQPNTWSIPSPPQVHTRPNKAKKRVNTNIDEAQIKMSQALDTLNQVLKEKRNKDKSNDEIEDECDIYAKLLAKKLRKYPEPMRARLMYQIDGLLLQNQVDLQPMSTYSRSSSSSLTQYSDDRYQSLTPSPIHVIQTQQPQQHVPVTQYSGDRYQTLTPSPIHVIQTQQPQQHVPVTQYSDDRSQTLTPSPIHVIQTQQPQQHVPGMPDSPVQLSIPETTSQNHLNIIETAYWNATQM